MIIEIKNLSFSYMDNKVIDNLSLNIKEKCFTAILGSNGSGKTTLLKNILKLVPVNSNTIYINKKDINTLHRKEIANLTSYVPQNNKINYQFTVKQLISLGRYLKNTTKKEDERIIDKMIDITNLEKIKNKYINEISGGEYQRAIIARALCQQSGILILDEPTSYLDPKNHQEIMNLLKQLVKKEKLTIITTLHDLNTAMDYCDETVLLKNGKVFKEGKTDRILTQNNIKEIYCVNSTLIENPYTKNKHIILEP